jgi:hypothetical protein
MKNVKIVAVFAENKLGQMARITGVLADAGVNVRWVTIATTESFGVIKFLVDKSEIAYHKLKEQGFAVSLLDVLAIEVSDRPGGLYRVATVFYENNINVENSSGFVLEPGKRAVLLIEVKDIETAKEVLLRQKLKLLSEDDLLNV